MQNVGKILLILILSVIINSCKKESDPLNPDDYILKADFAVFSDPHLYDSNLGTSGSAFEAYLKQDRKLLAESEAILQSMISTLSAEKLDFVLIPGDLTKDGELSGHQKMAAYLRTLESSGKKVYVVPGNHDINNSHAVRFSGSSAEPVQTINPNDFATIYSDFGYSEAIERDPNSLSYIAEPAKGILLIAMDPCRYKENVTGPLTGGKFSTATLEWILSKIRTAKSGNKVILGMMHHNLLEHYTGQKSIADEFVIDDFSNVSFQLAEAGLKIVFTGHYHSQDIVSVRNPNSFIFDIETGSLVTYPSPYRILKLTDDRKLKITSRRIETINYNTGGKSFQDYSKDFIEQGVTEIAKTYLMDVYGMNGITAALLAPYAAQVFIANTQGDEILSSDTKLIIQTLSLSPDPNIRYAAQVINAMWTDLPPEDNNLIIDMNTGETTKPDSF